MTATATVICNLVFVKECETPVTALELLMPVDGCGNDIKHGLSGGNPKRH